MFTPGDGLVSVTLGELKIGILICYDVEFPEAVRSLALDGAELVAVPTALIRPFAIVARTLVPARAFENQVHVAYAGLCGMASAGSRASLARTAASWRGPPRTRSCYSPKSTRPRPPPRAG